MPAAHQFMTIGPFELYEAMVLLFLLIGLVPMTIRFWGCRYKWFYVAYVAVFVGMLAGGIDRPLPRLREGVGIGLAGFLFWWTAVHGATDMEAWAFEAYQDFMPESDDDDTEEDSSE